MARSPWRWAFRLTVGLAILYWALQQVEPGELRSLLAGCRPVPLAHAFLLFFAAAVTGSIAWRMLLLPLGYELHLAQAVRLSLIGFFLNNLVPSGLGGDVYRAVALSGMGVPRVISAASVVVERWSAFLALLVATYLSYALALPLLRTATTGGHLGGFFADLRLDMVMGLFLVALTAAFAGTTWLALRAPEGWARRFSLGAPAEDFLETVRVFRRRPRVFLAAAAVNLGSPLLEGLAFSSIADALGLQLSPLLFLAFTPMFRVLNHLPVSVNAVGTQEVASLVFWNPLGATVDQALAISLLIHALKVSVSALGAPLYLVGAGYRVKTVEIRA